MLHRKATKILSTIGLIEEDIVETIKTFQKRNLQ